MRPEATDRSTPNSSAQPENRNLVSLADFEESSRRRSQFNDDQIVNLGEFKYHLDFTDPKTNKLMSLDQSAQMSINRDQAQQLDFGDIKELFKECMAPIEDALAKLLGDGGIEPGRPGRRPPGDGDNEPGRPGHRPSGDGDNEPGRPGRLPPGDGGDKPDRPGHRPPGDGGDSPDPGTRPPNGRGGGLDKLGFLFGGNAHNSLSSLEQAIGGKANLEMFPMKPGSEAGLEHIRQNLAKGVTSEVSLNGEIFPKGSRGIANGDYDAELTKMAEQMSRIKGADGEPAPILMRFGKEMNLQHKFVGTNEEFVAAYQHVHDVFERAGADNVSFVWCPTKKVDVSDVGDAPNPGAYWPGSKYVDVIGPDGYSSMHEQTSFKQIFEPFVNLAQRTGKPFMTSETNVKTLGLSDEQSAGWWRDAFDYVQGLRQRGVDILGVGGFYRHADTGEVLTAAEQRVLRDTFIRAEGS